MANKYKKKGSPYWWIRFKDASGKYKDVSSKLRYDNPQETKECNARLVLTEAEEGRKVNNAERWESWVPTFFETLVADAGTRKGYQQSWSWIRSYLNEIGVSTPSQVTYKVGIDFLAWRKRNGLKKETKATTAFRDLKVLRKLMNHAVRLEIAPGNPLNQMGIPRPEHAKKEEYTDAQIKQLYAAFAKHCKENDWKYVAFRIGMELGIRLAATQIAWDRVDFGKDVMIVTGKRSNGKNKDYPTIIPKSLKPLLLKQKALGGKYTVELPANASQLFGKFLHKVAKLPNHCFHGTRVTFNARLERNPDVNGRVAMQALNHTSASAHAVYQRPNVEDLRQIDGKVLYPPEPKFQKKSVGVTKHRNRAK
jgi:integrase